MRGGLRIVLCSLVLLFTLGQCRQPEVSAPQPNLPTRDDNMALGNPDGAITATSSPSTY